MPGIHVLTVDHIPADSEGNVQLNAVTIPPPALVLTTDGTYPQEANTAILGIIAKSATGDTINIGTTPGGTEIATGEVFAAGIMRGIAVIEPTETARTIYFTGITGTISIIIIKTGIPS